MSFNKSAKDVFDAWAQDYHAEGMENEHLPSVQQAHEKLTGPFPGPYLEIGVGNGYNLEHMAKGPFRESTCLGLDIAPNMVEKAAARCASLANVSVQEADFLTWKPPEDTAYGLIFSMEVFYYFASIQKGINHAAQMLAPGGTLMVMVNFYQEHEASHDWPQALDTPMTLWPAEGYKDAFARAHLKHVQQAFFPYPKMEPGCPGTLATWGVK